MTIPSKEAIAQRAWDAIEHGLRYEGQRINGKQIIQSAIDKSTEGWISDCEHLSNKIRKLHIFLNRVADHMICGSDTADTPLPTMEEWKDVLPKHWDSSNIAPESHVALTKRSRMALESRAAQQVEWSDKDRDTLAQIEKRMERPWKVIGWYTDVEFLLTKLLECRRAWKQCERGWENEAEANLEATEIAGERLNKIISAPSKRKPK